MSEENRTSRKVRTGIVVSDAREKTVTVAIELQFPHPKYKKLLKKQESFMHMMSHLKQRLETLSKLWKLSHNQKLKGGELQK